MRIIGVCRAQETPSPSQWECPRQVSIEMESHSKWNRSQVGEARRSAELIYTAKPRQEADSIAGRSSGGG